MKTQMKKLASILLALGMVLSLGSCGKPGTGENSGASKTGSDAEVSAGGTEAPVSVTMTTGKNFPSPLPAVQVRTCIS